MVDKAVGLSIFTGDEVSILIKSGEFTTSEIVSLSQGINLTLGTVMRARRVLDAAMVKDYSSLATKTEVNLLVDEVNKVEVKLFLVFKLLERKGLVSSAELDALSNEYVVDTEVTDNEQQPTTKARGKAGKPGRPSTRKRKGKQAN